MRRGLAIAALMAGFVATTTLPAAAQGWNDSWGYAGWNEPRGGGFGVSVGFGSPGYDAYAADWGYRVGPAYTYSTFGPGSAYAYEPGFAGPGSTYAYGPRYAYGMNFATGPVFGYQSYTDDAVPRSRVAVRGEFREGIRSRGVIRSGAVARERSVVRVGARDEAVIRGSVRERGNVRSQGQIRSNVRSGSAIRSDSTVGEGTTGMRARGSATIMRGEPTVGRGGGELRGSGSGELGRR